MLNKSICVYRTHKYTIITYHSVLLSCPFSNSLISSVQAQMLHLTECYNVSQSQPMGELEKVMLIGCFVFNLISSRFIGHQESLVCACKQSFFFFLNVPWLSQDWDTNIMPHISACTVCVYTTLSVLWFFLGGVLAGWLVNFYDVISNDCKH